MAMMPSPINLSSVPWCSKIIFDISSKYSLSISMVSLGVIWAEIPVNPLMSVKRTVTFWSVPPGFQSSGFFISISTTGVERLRDMVVRTFSSY